MIQQILKLADDANQGLTNSLEAYIELKKIEKALEQCLESVKEAAIGEADKYHEKSFELNGVKVEKKRAPGRWDYTGIPQWNKHKQEMKSLEELGKQAFAMAQKSKHINIIDEEGEVVPSAVYTEGSDTISISIKK